MAARQRSIWERARRRERYFSAQLRRISRHITEIVAAFDAGTVEGTRRMEAALNSYGDVLRPWAEAVAGRMIAEVDRDVANGFVAHARAMGYEMRRELQNAPTGLEARRLMGEQVELITSLPVGAAQRVHELALRGLSTGERPEGVERAIMETGLVTESRARLIARTETTRTATTLMRARAEHAGSTHFIWRTVGDTDVRESHRKLNGRTFAWNDPPICDAPNLRALPGAIWNCRCYAEPILPPV